MTSVVSSAVKLSHKQFRALLKKFRRKKKRQKLAKEREEKELHEEQLKESDPHFKEYEEDRRRNAELYEQFEERERQRKHRLWLQRENQAQVEFKKKQKEIEEEKLRKEEERKKIVAQFEQEQYLKDKVEEGNRKIKSQKEEALQEALSNLSKDSSPWHNPVAPANYIVEGKEREACQFFIKTGCCRFGERCSRGHPRPSVSSTLLIRGMYVHYSIGQSEREDFDTDNALEYEERERYEHFLNFYEDVLPEFKKHGRVLQFKVCNNHEPHLRGNVYVQYSKQEEAVEAYKVFNGRYYASRQITCDFTPVIKWRSAICGLHFRKMCPKGVNCNFLHVFRNPSDEFWRADRDFADHDFDSSARSQSRDHHQDRSSRRSHRPRDYSPNGHRGSSRRRRSSEDEDDDGRGGSSSCRSSVRDSSHRKKRHRRSRSRSQSLSDERSTSGHKKHKHKKKKKSKKHEKKELKCSLIDDRENHS